MILYQTNPNLIISCQRERDEIVEFLFESLKIEKLAFLKQAVGSLYATGRSSGLVWEMGESTNQICCVEDGFLDQKFIRSSAFTIESIMKEQVSFSQKELRSHWIHKHSKDFPNLSLPDGSEISSETDYFSACSNLLTSFTKNVDVQEMDIIFTGGVFCFPDFNKRVKELCKSTLNPTKLYLTNERFSEKDFYRYSGFLGASILGSLSGFSEFFVNKEDYLETSRNLMNLSKENQYDLTDDPKMSDGREKFAMIDKFFQ